MHSVGILQEGNSLDSLRKRPAANESAYACPPNMTLSATVMESRRRRMCGCIQHVRTCEGHMLEIHCS